MLLGTPGLVDGFGDHLTIDQLELGGRDFLGHYDTVIAKDANAIANAQYLCDFLELHGRVASAQL
jgi:hypothetical protein